MEQPAECSNIKRPRLSEHQNVQIRKETDADDDLSLVKSNRLALQQPQSVELNAVSVAVQNEYNEIRTNNSPEVNEHIETSANHSNLETINEDCLREIVKYLDIMDIVNLAKISERLQNFSETIIFPEASRKICINGFNPYRLLTPLYNRCTRLLTLQCLDIAFRYFGKFVEDLTFEYVSSPSEHLLANCNNLRKLCFRNVKFESKEHRTVQTRIERLQSLKELKLFNCIGITECWRPSNCISNVVKLRTDTGADVTGHFMDYFKNLTNLTFNCLLWPIDDVVKMFENSSASLVRLKVTGLSKHSARESVARLITDTLPKLEYLEFELYVNDETMFLIAMPHLKSVEITCKADYIVNTLLRTLSNNGIIRELRINGGIIVESVAQPPPPLEFNALRELTWTAQMSFSGILKSFTKAKMPEIQAIRFSAIRNHDINDLYKFIESKMTLRSITLSFDNCVEPLAFWRQICGFLKASSTLRRPFLSFFVAPFRLEKEVIELLKVNRNLLKVEEWK